jgi:hypothetical protein
MLREQLKHVFQNFLAALVIFILAGLLAYGETVAKKLGLPPYFLYATTSIAAALLIIDGIVAIGTAIIFAVKILRNQAGKD